MVGGGAVSAIAVPSALTSYYTVHRFVEDIEFRRWMRRDMAVIATRVEDDMLDYFPHLQHALRIEEDAEFGPDGERWERPASAPLPLSGGQLNSVPNLGRLALPDTPMGDVGQKFYGKLSVKALGDSVDSSSRLPFVPETAGAAGNPLAAASMPQGSVVQGALAAYGNELVGDMPPDEALLEGEEEVCTQLLALLPSPAGAVCSPIAHSTPPPPPMVFP